MLQRLTTHDCLSVTRHEIEAHWSTDDVIEQHEVLDEIDDARRRASERRK